MGTIIFVILRLIGFIDTKIDWVLLCYLIAIDSIGVPALLSLLIKKK